MTRYRATAAALIGATLLVGCASQETRGPRHFATASERPICKRDSYCPTSVFVSTEGERCIVQPAYDIIRVARGVHAKVAWELVPLDTLDGYEYRLDPSTGGVIIDANNPATDFAGPFEDSASRVVWTSVNLRSKEFKYSIQVQRRVASLSNTGDFVNCRLLDPKMINDGA